jgi:hypothetical protein
LREQYRRPDVSIIYSVKRCQKARLELMECPVMGHRFPYTARAGGFPLGWCAVSH